MLIGFRVFRGLRFRVFEFGLALNKLDTGCYKAAV